ncbi:hypothetical protein PAPHI01_1171 [Pancytospora philotis]|nr:hypothetical protein PAPHI01_1171 [Pancytospora philotis]
MAAPAQDKEELPEIKMKRAFIEKQMALLQYLEEAERLALVDLIHDPLVVHRVEDYAAAYKEQNDVRRIKRVLKSMYKLKRKGGNISQYIERLSTVLPPPAAESAPERVAYTARRNARPALFPLVPMPEPTALTRENATRDFKEHIRRINSFPKFKIQYPSFTRSLTVSPSHSQLIRKIDKQEGLPPKEQPQPSCTLNEITSPTSFRNGVLKSVGRSAGAQRPSTTPSSQGFGQRRPFPGSPVEAFGYQRSPPTLSPESIEEAIAQKKRRVEKSRELNDKNKHDSMNSQ